MQDFIYYAPTKVLFGRGAELRTGELVREAGGRRVLIHYGGGSAVRSGLIARVERSLDEAGIEHISLGGVVPNPRVGKVREGIELCRREGVDFLLAVGGGSVIDSAKAIAYGVPYGGDVWDFYAGRAKAVKALPVGAVPTIPAAGSEMSNSSVITDEATGLKRGYGNDISRCRFAAMNPELTFTLPPYQTACGAVDIMMHTFERYFGTEADMPLTDSMAEALLRAVIESAPKVLEHPDDYLHRAQIMWAGALSHNGLTGCGNSGDWATHKLEHELSGMFDVAHGAGLAALWGSWARYVMHRDAGRFARLAVNVMGVDATGTQEQIAEEGIAAVERFFRSLGMPVSISELIGRRPTDAEIAEMADKCSDGDSHTVGGLLRLGRAEMEKIYRMAE